VDYRDLDQDPMEFFAALDRHYLGKITRWEIVELIEKGDWDDRALSGSVSFDASDADLCFFLADLYADEMAALPGWE
jgi:hypothetical protein